MNEWAFEALSLAAKSPTRSVCCWLDTVGVLLAVSILSGRKVKDAKAFTTGGKAGSWMVCGAILGTLVGGQSTIGTAQLAFSFGLSAWWSWPRQARVCRG